MAAFLVLDGELGGVKDKVAEAGVGGDESGVEGGCNLVVCAAVILVLRRDAA
jgi:hypothetical protein